jgi:3-methyladenine DNA glycosylase AlkD
MSEGVRLLAAIRRALAAAGDASRAASQQAYMKSSMPYHGVRNPEMRAIAKQVLAAYDVVARGADGWRDDVLAIWRGAKFREERYAAIEVAQLRRARPFHTIDSLAMFEELVVSGAWWDYVDAIAAHDLGLILQSERSMRKMMLAWSIDDDIWKRRSAILCQLRFKAETDRDFLYACIEPSIARQEFWLRKAIGWALREYGKTDADAVARYVAKNEGRLSGLSKREALKVISSPAREGPRKSASSGLCTPSRGRPS